MEVSICLGDGKVHGRSFPYLRRKEVPLDRDMSDPYLNFVKTFDERVFRSFCYKIRQVYEHFIQDCLLIVERHFAFGIQNENLSKFVQKQWPNGKAKPFQDSQQLLLPFRYHSFKYSIVSFIQAC
jgi:hypothetical protein